MLVRFPCRFLRQLFVRRRPGGLTGSSFASGRLLNITQAECSIHVYSVPCLLVFLVSISFLLLVLFSGRLVLLTWPSCGFLSLSSLLIVLLSSDVYFSGPLFILPSCVPAHFSSLTSCLFLPPCLLLFLTPLVFWSFSSLVFLSSCPPYVAQNNKLSSEGFTVSTHVTSSNE